MRLILKTRLDALMKKWTALRVVRREDARGAWTPTDAASVSFGRGRGRKERVATSVDVDTDTDAGGSRRRCARANEGRRRRRRRSVGAGRVAVTTRVFRHSLSLFT